MEKYDGWIIKNKWGSFLIWTMAYRKRDLIEKIGKEKYREWINEGHKIIKIKLVEVA